MAFFPIFKGGAGGVEGQERVECDFVEILVTWNLPRLFHSFFIQSIINTFFPLLLHLNLYKSVDDSLFATPTFVFRPNNFNSHFRT